MGARTEFEPLSWEEAEQNRFGNIPSATGRAGGTREPDFPRTGNGQRHLLLDRCERLRSEIKRGHECLEQVRRDLAELRARLEEWPTYERSCGQNPLAEYAHALLVNERIEHFLPDWLQRREEKLEETMKELELCSMQQGPKNQIQLHPHSTEFRPAQAA